MLSFYLLLCIFSVSCFISVTSASEQTDHEFYCSDNKTKCYIGQMCCPYRAGGYGCCPFNSSESSCCSLDYCCDSFNCNPDGISCDNVSPTGWPISFPAYLLDKPANYIRTLANSIQLKCPDQLTACPSNRTCCLRSDGKYDCCSTPNGVCCNDSTHCCPANYQCQKNSSPDDNHNCYHPNSINVGYFPRFNATKLSDLKLCPNGIDHCSSNHTCCPTVEPGTTGCCKLGINAVCCPNKRHCCPYGSVCDEKDGLCISKAPPPN